ncbi:MAG: hypothetical protein J5698_07300 [Bacteroidaceae bacterium]|nr:hypothetical protein [Bacteroidaceae bacterium]
MKKSILFLSLLAAVLLCSCESAIKPDEEPYIRNGGGIVDRIFNSQPLSLKITSAEQAYSDKGSDFANDLFVEVCKQAKQDENVCLSPLSLEIALGMLANGVEPEAQKELLSVIAGKGVTIDDMNAWYHKLRYAFEETNNVKLANALWAQESYPIKEEFIHTNQTYYDAEVGYLDFFRKTKEAKDSICRWADLHTNGCIKELNLPLTNQTRMVLANATWLGALWANPFVERVTEKATFTSSSGKERTVDLMQALPEYYRYGSTSEYRMIDIPFANYSFSMLVALPRKGYTADDILSKVDWELSLKNAYFRLYLPKFDFKTTYKLKDFMPKLGIKKIFNPGALSGINPELEIAFINQDVSVSVHEAGTEMAAVTTIGLDGVTGVNTSPTPTDFRVDHSFVFCVRDNVSHNILFIGKVEDIGE